jgi:Leucine-rich repeat (LRR) protein
MSEKSGPGVLQEFLILQKTRAQSLVDVRAVNIWGFNLSDVSVVAKLPNVETLAFSVNHITSLAAFAQCRNLRTLMLRENEISDFAEIRHLQGLDILTNLSLKDNPIAQEPNYRQIVMRMLPQLRTLDDVPCDRSSIPKSFSTGDPPDTFEQHQPVPGARRQFNLITAIQPNKDAARRKPRVENSGNDANMLAAVLSLIPTLSVDSLQTVLEAIQARCAQ